MRKLSPDEYNSEFERNYEYYRQRMERRLVKQVYDRERFDDICQDAFVRALTYLARQDEEKLPQTDYHLGNLLSIMAIQVAIDDGRKDKSKDYSYLSDTQLPELSVEEEAGIIKRLDLRKDLDQMPLRYQQCVLLKDQGFKQKQIAAMLGISESEVSEILHDVKTQLYPIYYPVAVSHQREIWSLRQYAEEVCPGITADLDLIEKLHTSNGNKPSTYEWIEWAEKEGKEMLRVIRVDTKVTNLKQPRMILPPSARE